MSPRARVAAFVALLAAVFAGAMLLGGALDPDGGDGDGSHGASTSTTTVAGAGHGAAAPGADHGDRHDGPGVRTATTAYPVQTDPAAPHGGLQLFAERTSFEPGRPDDLRFRIVNRNGAVVRSFDVEQARRMHVIVVRRDLRRYQHLHPTLGRDGAWSTRLTLPDAGTYRAFADFRTQGERHTIGVDLLAAGGFKPLPLPPPQDTVRVDGYDVTLREQEEDGLRFAVSRGGRPVTDLQPYLGSLGHLVMLREGNLAYRHVHPLDKRGLAFHTGDVEPATYRMFLQFRHRDRVHTAAFTRIVKP